MSAQTFIWLAQVCPSCALDSSNFVQILDCSQSVTEIQILFSCRTERGHWPCDDAWRLYGPRARIVHAAGMLVVATFNSRWPAAFAQMLLAL